MKQGLLSIWVAGLYLICISTLGAQVNWQQVERVSQPNLSKALEGRIILPKWIEGTDYFHYQTLDSLGNIAYYVQQVGRRGAGADLLRSREQFVIQYQQLTGDSSLRANKLYLHGLKFSAGQVNQFRWKYRKHSFVYDRSTGKLSADTVPELSAKQTQTDESADYEVLGGGHNLYLKDLRSSDIRPFSHEGSEELSFTYKTTDQPQKGNARGQWWGNKYIVTFSDDSQVGEISLVNWLSSPRPKIRKVHIPFPNDSNVRITRIWWGDPQSGQGKFIPLEKYEGQVVELNPMRSLGAIYLTRRDRWGKHIDLCRLDSQSGELTELISEETLPHLNVQLFNYRVLDGGKRIVWWSERTGRGNYYLYDGKGKLLHRLTYGASLVAGDIVGIDSIRGRMIFAGYGAEPDHNPYYRHYYSVPLAKSSARQQLLLTPEDAEHELELSPDKRYFIDKYSRMDLPPIWTSGRTDRAKSGSVFAEIDPQILVQAGWRSPKLVSLLASDDSTRLYGVLYEPSQLDSTKKYPIISNVYPGPQSDQIPRGFALDDNGNQSLSEMGCLVLTIGARGSSPLRGRDFYCFGYGNLRDYPLSDDKHCIETLAKQYRYIDLGRVGIYGHSGGGFETVAAMCKYPDFYKVGFAASGNHDNSIYINWWANLFQGDKPIPTTIEIASELRGKLMIAVGDMDNNVPPGSSIRLADALIRAGKDFQFFLFPGKQHDLDSPYYLNLIRYYFGRNLLGYQLNDTDIINHR